MVVLFATSTPISYVFLIGLGILEIAFTTIHLRSLCENEDYARADLGEEVAATLRRRLADLHAAKSLKDVVVGNLRDIGTGSRYCKRIDLWNNVSMDFCSNHARERKYIEAAVNWDKVNRIRITRIGQTNE